MNNQCDYDVLKILYDSLNGHAWNFNFKWFKDKNLNNWYGIYTNKYHRVEMINLPDNRLVGKIPDEIGDLKYLKFLNLSSNSIRGRIPKTIGKLKNLKQLNLSTNQLSEIPHELWNLPNLERINLLNNRLCGQLPEKIKNYKQLFLGGNQNLTGTLPKYIKSVSIKNTNITFATEFSNKKIIAEGQQVVDTNCSCDSYQEKINNINSIAQEYIVVQLLNKNFIIKSFSKLENAFSHFNRLTLGIIVIMVKIEDAYIELGRKLE